MVVAAVVPLGSLSGSSGRPRCSDRASTAPFRGSHSPSRSGSDLGHWDERTDTKTAAYRIQTICSTSLVALARRNQPCSRFRPVPSRRTDGNFMGSPTLLTGGSILPMAPLASQCSNPSGRLRFAVRCHSSDRRRLGSSAMASAHHSHPPGLNTDCFGCFHLAAWSESARGNRVSSTRCLSSRGRPRGSHLETPVGTRLPSHDRSRFFNPGALSWLVQLPLLQCPHPSQERRWCHLAKESNFRHGLKLPNRG